MSRRLLLALGGAVVVLALLVVAVPRLVRRATPPPPAVVRPDADAARLASPPLAARLRRLVAGSAADERSAGPKLIALTFDDGPYAVDTPQLLAVLRDLHVPATFFLIGRDAEQRPGLVRAIEAAGGEIADHTQTHPNLDQLDDAAVAREIAMGAQTLGAMVPDPAIRRLFRPPHGRYTVATLRTAQRAGYTTVLWTDDPGDWRNVSSASLLAHVASRATRPEILLLHNGRPATTTMLPALVTRFRAAGYTFVTVGDLLRQVGPDVINRAARAPLPVDG